MTEEYSSESTQSSESSEIPYAEVWETSAGHSREPVSIEPVSIDPASTPILEKAANSNQNPRSVAEIYGHSQQDNFDQAAQQQVARSALAQGRVVESLTADSPLTYTPAPPIPEDMDNVAAVGGAVSALVLGIWSIFGSFITPLSFINAVLGLLLGSWGLSSRKRRMARVGIFLCMAGIFLSFANSLGLSSGLLYLFGR